MMFLDTSTNKPQHHRQNAARDGAVVPVCSLRSAHRVTPEPAVKAFYNGQGKLLHRTFRPIPVIIHNVGRKRLPDEVGKVVCVTTICQL